MSDFTHTDENGHVRMVDVSDKTATTRTAFASGRITMSEEAYLALTGNQGPKGNILETARIAGVMGAKKTSDLIPMCHPLNLTHVRVDFEADDKNRAIDIIASARISDRTGVEMEALTAVSVAALTIYDMCKAMDKSMVISDICLTRKTGGKSGEYNRNEQVAL